MRNLISILILSFSSYAFSQKKSNSIPSIKDNIVWLEEVEKITSKQEKIEVIIRKIKTDSIFQNSELKLSPYISKDGHIHNKFGNEVPCKIIFVLNQNKATHILDLNSTPNYSALLKYLNVETIEKITILKAASATSLFGIRGNCGVVLLKANDRNLKKLIRNLKRRTTVA